MNTITIGDKIVEAKLPTGDFWVKIVENPQGKGFIMLIMKPDGNIVDKIIVSEFPVYLHIP